VHPSRDRLGDEAIVSEPSQLGGPQTRGPAERLDPGRGDDLVACERLGSIVDFVPCDEPHRSVRRHRSTSPAEAIEMVLRRAIHEPEDRDVVEMGHRIAEELRADAESDQMRVRVRDRPGLETMRVDSGCELLQRLVEAVHALAEAGPGSICRRYTHE
jgi:hypothetical protein